jgi:Zn-dependent M28 family amino/carboxypeptidase
MRSLLLLSSVSVLTLAACGAPENEADLTLSDLQIMPKGTETCFETRMSDAMRDVCVLSADVMAGRLVGTEANARARDYLLARYEAMGLQPVGESFVHAFDFERSVDFRNPDAGRETLTGYNLIARIPGADSSRTMAVTAHYDHVGPGENNEIFNGADDNASGVGAILAVAEHFLANPPEHDIVIIAFDAEEGGLNGARAFVANPPAGLGPVTLNYNLDLTTWSAEK